MKVILLPYFEDDLNARCRYRTGPHTVFDCVTGTNNSSGLILFFVEQLSVKSHHWWRWFGRVKTGVLFLCCYFYCDVSTVNKLFLYHVILTWPIFIDIISCFTSLCSFYLNQLCCFVTFLCNKTISKMETICSQWFCLNCFIFAHKKLLKENICVFLMKYRWMRAATC